jgi:hypothetical protein
MVRVMDWDQLIEYLGDVWGGDVGCHAIQAEGREIKHTINITTPYIFISHFSHFHGDGPDCDPERDLAYYVRESGRLVCRVELGYAIIVNDAK